MPNALQHLLVVPASNSPAAAANYWPLYLLGLPGLFVGAMVSRTFIMDVFCIFACCCRCCSARGARKLISGTNDEADISNGTTRVLHGALSLLQVLVALAMLVYLASWPSRSLHAGHVRSIKSLIIYPELHTD